MLPDDTVAEPKLRAKLSIYLITDSMFRLTSV